MRQYLDALERVKQRLMNDIKPFIGSEALEDQEPPNKKAKYN